MIESVCKRIVHLKAVGHADMSGDQFSRIFADAIDGQSYGRPLGIADVSWNGCCWSVKTVYHRNPHQAERIRLISGRNSPTYSSGIDNPFENVQETGNSVLNIYNERINKAKWDHDDCRMVVLIRHMAAQEFTIFERPIVPFVANDYQWQVNQNNNLVGLLGDMQMFTWQPHGSQFTIHENIPASATRFRIKQQPLMLQMIHVLRLVRFRPDWIEIL